MTVRELIELLQKMPKQCQVAVYSELDEGSDMAKGVRLYTKKEGPYNKADDVWNIYGLPKEEQVVFIT